MRKLTTILLLCMIAAASFAQVENRGKFGTEIYLNPWKSDGNTFSLIDGVKFRYFTSNHFAIRGTLNFDNNHSKAFVYVDEYNSNWEIIGETETKYDITFTTFSFMPGVEYHIANYKRASVYVGGEVGFEIQRNSYKRNDEDEKVVIKGMNGTNRNLFKAGVFTGIDVYLIKNLYLGAELGLQYKGSKTLEETTTTTYPGGSKIEETDKNHYKFSTIGFYCLPAVRIGWNF